MKILGTADTHITSTACLAGMSPVRNGRPLVLVQSARTMSWICVTAARERIDLGIHAGDYYEDCRPTPDAEAVGIIAAVNLSETSPWVVLVGNHDRPKGGGTHALEPMKHIAPGRLWIADEPEPVALIGTGDGARIVPVADMSRSDIPRAVVFPLPYPAKAHAALAARSADDENRAISEGLCAILDDFALHSDEWRARGVPTVLAYHGTIRGARWLTYQVAPLSDLQIPAEIYWPRFDVHVCGHIHMRQPAPGTAGLPGYVGAPDRHDHGEADTTPSVSVFDVNDTVTCRAITNSSPRRFVTMETGTPDEPSPALTAILAAGGSAGRTLAPMPDGSVGAGAVDDETVYRVRGDVAPDVYEVVAAAVRTWRLRGYIVANETKMDTESRARVKVDATDLRDHGKLIDAALAARLDIAPRRDRVLARLAEVM